MLSVAVFQFFGSSITTSEDFSSVSICLQLVEGLLATNIIIELKQGTNDVMATSKITFLVLIVISISVYICSCHEDTLRVMYGTFCRLLCYFDVPWREKREKKAGVKS